MNRFLRPVLFVAAAMGLAALSGCESGNYGGTTSVSYAYGAYPGGYYPGYYPGYGCCWDDPDYIVVNPPDRPENRPDRPTTLPAGPENLPASRPTTRPAPTASARPATTTARPAPRPTPRPMGGGGRRR
jgi:hypothetical protein